MDPGLDENGPHRITGRGISFSHASFWSRKQASGTLSSSLYEIRPSEKTLQEGPLSSTVLRNGTKTRDETKAPTTQGERLNLPGPQTHSKEQAAVCQLLPSAAGSSGRSKRSSHPGCWSASSQLLTGARLRNVHVGPTGGVASHVHPDRGMDNVVASVSLTCEYITDPHADMSPGNRVNLGRQSPSWKAEDWQNAHG